MYDSEPTRGARAAINNHIIKGVDRELTLWLELLSPEPPFSLKSFTHTTDPPSNNTSVLRTESCVGLLPEEVLHVRLVVVLLCIY